MSTRVAGQVLTGTPPRSAPTVVLGYRSDGRPGITITIRGRQSLPFAEIGMVCELIEDLKTAIDHLGEKTEGAVAP